MDPMNVDNWIIVLGNFGFPIVITGYLLVRFEKRIESLAEAIDNLKDAVNK